MSIWRTTATPEELNERGSRTLPGFLGIRVTEIGPDFLRATMPVNERTHQPFGVLHGGASVALAESAGLVTATARPFHLGRSSHVWHIEIRDEQERLVCVSRLTMAVVERRTKS